MNKHRLHRLKTQITQIFLLVTSYWLLVTGCYAGPVSSEELINNAKLYDGKEVVFQGEVIGDVMKRGNFSWININDGQNAVGIFFENSIPYNITFTGDYDHRGDIVEVKGVFHRACIEHGGDLDIHAAKITKLKEGYAVIHKPGQYKTKITLWLTIFLFILIAVVTIKR